MEGPALNRVGIVMISAWSLSRMLESIGREFARRGVEVVWLAESHLAEVKYGVDLSQAPREYFTDWVRNGCTGELGGSGANWRSLFPLIDRSSEFGWYRKKHWDWSSLPGQLAGFFKAMIRKYGLDGLVHENVSNAFAYGAAMAAQRAGIPYLGIGSSRLPGRFEIWHWCDDIGDRVALAMEALKRRSEPAEVEAAAGHYMRQWDSAPPDYMRGNRTSVRYSYVKHLLRKLDWIPRATRFWLSNEYDLAYSYKEPHPYVYAYYQVRRNILRRLRLPALARLVERPVPGERYFVYPLHFHPEASTSVQAPYYAEEDAVVRALSLTLPDGYRLYVKEHPNAAGFKPLVYYRRIAEMPNVRLLHWDVPVPPLLAAAEGVITLTSTMGYEALLMARPVFLLGNVFYRVHPFAEQVRGFSEMADALRRVAGVAKAVDSHAWIEANRRFVVAYWQTTYPGRVLGFVGGPEDPDPAPIVNALLSEWVSVRSAAG